MGTFSQLVDEITAESNRVDLRLTIATYVNQTIRECHSRPDRSDVMVTFGANMKEAILSATSATAQLWDIPDPTVYQEVHAIRFDSIYDASGKSPYAKLCRPGSRYEQELYAYYRSGDSLALKGYGGVGSTISIAWFEFLPRLLYADAASRLATYDFVSGWSYAAGVVTDADKTAARARCSNWMIQRWYDTIAEGTRAKVYKRLSDDGRARTSYSQFQSMRGSLVSSEAFDSGG